MKNVNRTNFKKWVADNGKIDQSNKLGQKLF